MRRSLLIVGKSPQAGHVKTRLVPPLTPQGAAALSAGFLLDSVRLGQELEWERVTVVHPRGSGPDLGNLLPRSIRLLEQQNHGLANALTFAFENHLAEGFERVILIGSDNPTLPIGLVEAASSALETHEVTIGPSVDGGYYLIGMRHPHPGLFASIDWSTPRVYTQTCARAADLDLSLASLPEWYDVDEPPDLEQLLNDLEMLPPSVARHTRAALEHLAVPALERARY